MALPRLPNELLLAIISFIPSSDHTTLRACQLTSRTLKEYSNGVLYGRIDISWIPTRGIPLLATLEQTPSLASLVKSVTVDFPRFYHVGQITRRYDETVASMWEEEERGWPAMLRREDPEDVEHWETQRRNDFQAHLDSDSIKDQLWEKADKEALTDLLANGNAEWVDQSLRGPRGRSEGSKRLEGLLASLPNLREVDYTSYNGGIPSLPQLTVLTLHNNDLEGDEPFVPDTSNIEELRVTGAFLLRSDRRLAKLHTLRIDSHPRVMQALLPQLIEASRPNLKALEALFERKTLTNAGSLANILGTILPTIPSLEVLLIPRHHKSIVIDDLSAFTSYLAGSALRSVFLPFRPSPLLFASLPPTIEWVVLMEHGDLDGPLTSLDSLLVEKARLPRLVRVEMQGCLADAPRETWAAEDKRVRQGRLLGVDIVLK
ncbi:hypothetical protein RQP46_001644 [Phenoliferia psychrophenolica]